MANFCTRFKSKVCLPSLIPTMKPDNTISSFKLFSYISNYSVKSHVSAFLHSSSVSAFTDIKSMPSFHTAVTLYFSGTPHSWNCISFLQGVNSIHRGNFRGYHDGRPRGPLWRGKKMIGKEALFVIIELKRVKNDYDRLKKLLKTHVFRLLKADMISVLLELERQGEVYLAFMLFSVIQKQDWYKPDVYLYKDLIISLARSGKMKDVMTLWESMKKDELFPDFKTYAVVMRSFLKEGSLTDAMNIYEDMKKSPEPPDQMPYRILLKGLLPHPLLRDKVKKDFEELFPDDSVHNPLQEIFGIR